MVSHWSDSKSPQMSRTLLSILADLNNVVVWMVSTCPLISKSPSPFINPLVTVLRPPIIISLNVTQTFHGFFNSVARSRYLSFFSLFFDFTRWSADTAKSTIRCVLFFFLFFFLLIIKSSGRLAEIKWSVCVSKSQRSVCVSFFRGDSGLCIYHLLLWSNFNFFALFTLPTQSCQVLYAF